MPDTPSICSTAHLISAAPCLLFSLNELLEEIDFEIDQRKDGGNAEDWDALEAKADRARAVIAKAKGGAQ